MLKFIVEVRIQASAPKDDKMKSVFMKNAENIIQKGLEAMTVPDWKATVVELEEEDD